MLEALAWGAFGASSLFIGAVIGTVFAVPVRIVGLVMAFGAGALISAVSFELTEEAFAQGGPRVTAAGLAVGALAFYAGDRALHSLGAGQRKRVRDEEEASGETLLLGAVLDGVPESAVLGTTLLAGGGVSVAMLAAIFVSNLPEAIGGASGMRASSSRGRVLVSWGGVVAVCALASALGYAVLEGAGGDAIALLQGFAAGAVLTMLIDAMIPDAFEQARRPAGLIAVLGFAVAAALSATS